MHSEWLGANGIQPHRQNENPVMWNRMRNSCVATVAQIVICYFDYQEKFQFIVPPITDVPGITY